MTAVSPSPSRSSSLARTPGADTSSVLFLATLHESADAVGASFCGVTSIDTLPVSLPPAPSDTVYKNPSVPLKSAFGV